MAIKTGGSIPLQDQTNVSVSCAALSQREAVGTVSAHWGSGSHLLLKHSQSESDLAQAGPRLCCCVPTKNTSCWGCAGGGLSKQRHEESFDLAHGLERQTAQTDSSPSSLLSQRAEDEQHKDWPDSLFSVDQTPTCLVPLNTAATTIPPSDRLRHSRLCWPLGISRAPS